MMLVVAGCVTTGEAKAEAELEKQTGETTHAKEILNRS